MGSADGHRLQRPLDRLRDLVIADRAWCARTWLVEETVDPLARKTLAPTPTVCWLPIPSRSAIAVFVAPAAAIRIVRARSASAWAVERPINQSLPQPCHEPLLPPSFGGNNMIKTCRSGHWAGLALSPSATLVRLIKTDLAMLPVKRHGVGREFLICTVSCGARSWPKCSVPMESDMAGPPIAPASHAMV